MRVVRERWRRTHWVRLAAAAALLWGCTDEGAAGNAADAGGDTVLDVAFDVSSEVDAAPDAVDVAPDRPDAAEITEDCPGSAPMCAYGCGGDAFEIGDCVGGEWVCPADTVPIDDCPPGSCFGLPLPGEVCDGGWQCRPWENGELESCPTSAFLCADCRSFEEPYDTGACTCSCRQGTVSCGADPCELASTSSLPGVSLRLTGERCVFALDEVAAGVDFGWEITVESTVADVVPRPQDAGNCGLPGESGLITFERISGSEQQWCRCDLGLCDDGQREPVTLSPGTYSGSFEWMGRNWDGPSDTGNQPGDPFPPGTYTVRVNAVGTLGTDANAAPFEVSSEMTITIVP